MGDSDLRGEHSILPEVRRAILAFRSSYITSTEVEPIRQPQPFLLNAGEGSHPRGSRTVEGPLLVPQRHHRIDLRRPARRDVSGGRGDGQ